jgi:hypothetical protein
VGAGGGVERLDQHGSQGGGDGFGEQGRERLVTVEQAGGHEASEQRGGAMEAGGPVPAVARRGA